MKKRDEVKEEETSQENGLAVELEETKSKYLRALADYQNLEKQTQVWREEFASYATSGIVRKLLEVLDDLEKAQEHIADKGLELIINKLKKVLEEEGVTEIDLEGQMYNANLAEVVGTQSGEEDNKIVKVLQKGYRIRERVIRVAKVIVSIKK